MSKFLEDMLCEWDGPSYQRKFNCCLAWCRAMDLPWGWRYVYAIKDIGLVNMKPNAKATHQIVCEAHDRKPQHDVNVLPVIEFGYRPIYPGVYWSTKRDNAYLVMKKHQKSYKVGLSTENFKFRDAKNSAYMHAPEDIDLESPVMDYQFFGKLEVFNRKLVRVGTKLYADGNDIGFLDKGQVFLKSNLFRPFVEPYLEEKWQIASF